mmetsp:Transcript_25935/g.35804  ORF Transcript_25935/g.35804 Transcript_25935/m.35804 type:complete len:285 (-) Transcript_25935:152-1006(-)|eukprot:CAMPEP_0196587444 /NCGR_PEP_ID=MMETSP1081-20130531/57492_1 /TAXON_ID=36882 /ORGANISM="Pyramimonas amylifera, Strain CCMP720" /LENGTH=284 /DNA_ID=CAMNT_0041909631 /DNA_START=132 /DNA_END=986 /DNA_ORIENTATION=-
MDPSLYSSDSIKLGGATGAAVISNVFGIPFDRFRVLVAQDLKCSTSLGSHLAETFRSPGSAFTGGIARISMKQMATSLNLYVPGDFRAAYPFASNFAIGVGFSPILNVPRMLQLGRISGLSYPEAIKRTFMTTEGLKGYAQNTVLFGPGEGFRMMMCFGTKDFLMPKIGGGEDAHLIHQSIGIPLHTGKMAMIAGPLVAAVETTSALVTETISTIQAGLQNQPVGAPKKDFMAVLKETITPNYTGRCWVSLFTKNVMANTPLFWFMFAADFYGRIATKREAGEV